MKEKGGKRKVRSKKMRAKYIEKENEQAIKI